MEEADYEAQCQAEAEAEGQAMEAMAAEAENEAMIKNEEIIAQDEFNEKYIEKQKVREVIEKLEKQDWTTHKENLGLVRAVFYDLKKELGLK